MMHRFDQLKVLCNHYGCDVTDVYDNDVKKADALLSIAEQQLESEEFSQEFDDTSLPLTNDDKSEARRRWNRGEMKQGEMQDYNTTNKPSSSDVYTAMCKDAVFLTQCYYLNWRYLYHHQHQELSVGFPL